MPIRHGKYSNKTQVQGKAGNKTRQYLEQVKPEHPGNQAFWKEAITDIPHPLENGKTMNYGQFQDYMKGPNAQKVLDTYDQVNRTPVRTSKEAYQTKIFNDAQSRFYKRADDNPGQYAFPQSADDAFQKPVRDRLIQQGNFVSPTVPGQVTNTQVQTQRFNMSEPTASLNKTYKKGTKYVKKAANGLQAVAVPEQGSISGVLSSATNMASIGSQFGPIGGAIGGIAGLATGLFQKSAQDKANKEAITRNKYLTANRAVDGDDPSIDQRSQTFKKGTKMIEIEGKKTPEIHTDKNFNVKNLGSIPHSKGGNKVQASEGDIVFNTQDSITKYNKIASAIQNGDKQTLNKEKNKLPEDNSNKAQDGNKSVKPPRKYHLNSYGDKVYDSEKQIGYNPNAKQAPLLGNTISNLFKPTVYNSQQLEQQKRLTDGSSSKGADKPFVNADTSPVRPFNVYNPLAIPGINPSNKLSNAPVSKPINRNPIGQQGKKISGRITPVTTPSTPSLVTNFGNASIGDGSDLKGQYSDNQYAGPPKPVDGVYNPAINSIDNKSTSSNTTLPNTTKPNNFGNTANNLMQLTGVANNLYQGLKSEKPINEKYFDPRLNKYVDRSERLRQASNSAAVIQNSNARNTSGGNISNYRANANQSAINNLGRQDAINEQEMSRRDAIEASNVGIKNAAGQYNLQRKDMYQSQIDGQRAAKQSYIDQAASDIGQLGMARQEESYLRSKDDKANASQSAGLKAIGTRDFNRDENGNKVFNESSNDTTIGGFTFPSLLKKTSRNKKSNVGLNTDGNKGVKTSKYKMK